jgi:tryptophan-rich sensory protein
MTSQVMLPPNAFIYFKEYSDTERSHTVTVSEMLVQIIGTPVTVTSAKSSSRPGWETSARLGSPIWRILLALLDLVGNLTCFSNTHTEWCKSQDALEVKTHMNMLFPRNFAFNLITFQVYSYKCFYKHIHTNKYTKMLILIYSFII